MIPFSKLSAYSKKATSRPQRPGWVPSALIRTVPYISTSTGALKLKFYRHFAGFIQVIGLYLIRQHPELDLFGRKLEELYHTPVMGRRLQSFVELLLHFELAHLKDNRLQPSRRYLHILQSDHCSIDWLIHNPGSKLPKDHAVFQTLAADYRFITDLMRRYRNTSYQLPHIIRNKEQWSNLVDSSALDYEIRLCETLSYLTRLRFPNKIKSPFNEAYYTESGRNAFRNYTQHRFTACYGYCTSATREAHTLDIGCGYGNYIRVIQEQFPLHRVTGIEMNPEVYRTTANAFDGRKNIQLINQNILNWETVERFDVLLINYAIFYFNRTEKLELLRKSRALLKSGGSVLICQYFSQLEPLKQRLATLQRDTSITQRIERYFGNKILYANTLWNDSVDTFSEAARWDEFETLCQEAGLQIESLTHADRFYYSLFIRLTVKHTSSGPAPAEKV